jgi:hypothetical protein
VDRVLVEVEIGVAQRDSSPGRIAASPTARIAPSMMSPYSSVRLARAFAQALVLLVGNDLEVGFIDAALALARSQAGEVVAADQLAIECVVEELADRLLGVGTLGERPGDRLVAGEAVQAPLTVLTDERP